MIHSTADTIAVITNVRRHVSLSSLLHLSPSYRANILEILCVAAKLRRSMPFVAEYLADESKKRYDPFPLAILLFLE